MSPSQTSTADVIVVGAGAAGAIVAARLSSDPACRVILLEAGGAGRSPVYRVPVMTGVLAQSRHGVWADQTEPEPFLANRRIAWPHGRVVGGSAAINGMVWMRGRPSDFERWKATGLDDWGWDAVKPVYDAIENSPGDHDGHGPLTITRHDGTNPLYDAYVAAGLQAGHPEATNFNRGSQEGVGRFWVNIANGARQSSARAFLQPARRRGNLRIVTQAVAQRILFEERRAIGIAALVRGRPVEFHAGRVVLCGGAVNSPHLLMLSGLGAAADLARHGIAVRHELPGIGENLQDHICTRVAHESIAPVSMHGFARLDRAALGFLRALATGSGPAATTPFGAGFVLKSSASEPEPDLESVFIPALSTARLWAPLIRPPTSGHGFLATVYQLRPESRGRITLRSADPSQRPKIVANYLSTARDRDTTRLGVGMLREMFAQKAFDRYRGRELAPLCGSDDASLDKAVSELASTAYHPVGTCKMGPDNDPMAVVDGRLRVRGIDGLYVGDASVMPSITSGNTNAPAMMIGYRCADFVAGT